MNKLSAIIRRLDAAGLLSLDVLLLSLVMGSALVATLGFFLGLSICGFYFWGVALALGAVATVASWRRGMSFALTVAVLLLLTGYSFSYTGGDALTCWWPMQGMMRNGWNPVWQSTPEDVVSQCAGMKAAFNHIVIYSKLVPLMGAIVGSAMGFFAGDTFLGFVLIACLLAACIRFAQSVWNCSAIPAWIFALATTFTPKMVAMFGGYVDYHVYLAFMLSLLSLTLLTLTGKCRDAFVLIVASVILFSVKSNGIAFALVLLLACPVCLWRQNRRLAWLVPLLALAGCLIMNVNPLVPLAKQVFGPAHAWTNVTSDFTGNADAIRLGYFWRIVYAWVSPSLVPGHPEFYVVGGVGGYGSGFRLMLMASVAALLLSRKNVVTLLCVGIFILSNALPLKYIGYARYCPQIWCLPMLAAFNMAYAPIRVFGGWKRTWFVIRSATLCGMGLFVSVLLFRTASFYVRGIRLEFQRQADLATLREQPCQWRLADDLLTRGWSYTTLARSRFAGLPVSATGDRACHKLNYVPTEFSFRAAELPLRPSEPFRDSPSAWISNFIWWR